MRQPRRLREEQGQEPRQQRRTEAMRLHVVPAPEEIEIGQHGDDGADPHERIPEQAPDRAGSRQRRRLATQRQGADHAAEGMANRAGHYPLPSHDTLYAAIAAAARPQRCQSRDPGTFTARRAKVVTSSKLLI